LSSYSNNKYIWYIVVLSSIELNYITKPII